MAQHVEVDGKWNAGPLADDLDQPVDGVRRERRAALGGEDIAAVGIFFRSARFLLLVPLSASALSTSARFGSAR